MSSSGKHESFDQASVSSSTPVFDSAAAEAVRNPWENKTPGDPRPLSIQAAPQPTFWRSLFLGNIDFYVGRQFVWIFAVTFTCLGLFFVLMDFMGNCEDFFTLSEQRKLSIGWLLLLFYGPRLLEVFDMFLGFFVIMSGIFTLCLLETRLELTALTSMGISRVRAAFPIFILAAIITVFGAYNREVLIPKFRNTLSSVPSAFLDKDGDMLEKKSDSWTRIVVFGKKLDQEKKTIAEPSFTLPLGSLDKYGSDLQGTIAFWKPPIETDELSGRRSAGFIIQNATIDGKPLDNRKSLYLKENPILITPSGNPWLKPGECFVASRLTFQELSFGRNSPQYSQIPELLAMVPRVRALHRSDLLVEVYQRLARPFVDYLCIFVGLSFILAPHAQAIASIVKAIGWLLIVLIVIQLGKSLGGDEVIPAAAGGWIPAIFMAACCAWTWDDVFC